MNFLRTFSIFWSLSHTLVLFLLLLESRYNLRKTLIVILSTMVPLLVINGIVAIYLDTKTMGTLLLVTLSVPSLAVFWILSRHRDGRFLFTFCLVDTMVLELLYITQILNHYITPNSCWFMFLSRLVAYPALELLLFKYFRRIYSSAQRQIHKGWGTFALIGGLMYVLITLTVNLPVSILERPEYLPALCVLFVLIPVIYVDIILTLRQMLKQHQATEQENILRLQAHNMSLRIEELAAADQRFRMERHNYRHKMKTIASLVESRQYEELTALVADYNETYRSTQVIHYCANPVIDAVISSYVRSAQASGIAVTLGLDFPDKIPVDETELATVFANALENAINACKQVPQESRFLELKVLSRPTFMIMIRNSFSGQVEFDDHQVPVNRKVDHGFGTRFIAAFCKKHNAYYLFKAEEQVFSMYLNF